jgi:hypothetical protein
MIAGIGVFRWLLGVAMEGRVDQLGRAAVTG